MYACIQRCFPQLVPAEDRPAASRALAAKLGTLPGFVAHVLLEEPDGTCTAVSVYEDQDSLAEARQLITTWFTCDAAPAGIVLPVIAAGEVIAQRGL